jgi:hypothetical protein
MTAKLTPAKVIGISILFAAAVFFAAHLQGVSMWWPTFLLAGVALMWAMAWLLIKWAQ